MINTGMKIGARFLLGDLGVGIYEGLKASKAAVEKASQEGIDELELELKKQTMKLEFDREQAKIAQEYSIAEKIKLAHEVKIEEFYDISGDGKLGIEADYENKSCMVGIKGRGQKVTKRVYYFKSFPNEELESSEE